MEKYFDIRYEFDVPTVHKAIDEQIAKGTPGYICVADGNILNMVYHNEDYRAVVDGSMFSICDSSWVPKFVKWIYGYRRSHYCGSDIFIDVVRARKHKMIFLGTKQRVLDALQQNLAKENPDVRNTKIIDIYRALKEYNVNITVYAPWANPAIAKHEYGIEITNELPADKFDALIMGVARNEFKELDVTEFVKENHVIFNVKGTLPKVIVDARL